MDAPIDLCLFCHGEPEPTPGWEFDSSWSKDCAESVHDLLDLDIFPASLFLNAKYCGSCKVLVRDVDFTSRRIKVLGRRLSKCRETIAQYLLDRLQSHVSTTGKIEPDEMGNVNRHETAVDPNPGNINIDAEDGVADDNLSTEGILSEPSLPTPASPLDTPLTFDILPANIEHVPVDPVPSSDVEPSFFPDLNLLDFLEHDDEGLNHRSSLPRTPYSILSSSNVVPLPPLGNPGCSLESTTVVPPNYSLHPDNCFAHCVDTVPNPMLQSDSLAMEYLQFLLSLQAAPPSFTNPGPSVSPNNLPSYPFQVPHSSVPGNLRVPYSVQCEPLTSLPYSVQFDPLTPPPNSVPCNPAAPPPISVPSNPAAPTPISVPSNSATPLRNSVVLNRRSPPLKSVSHCQRTPPLKPVSHRRRTPRSGSLGRRNSPGSDSHHRRTPRSGYLSRRNSPGSDSHRRRTPRSGSRSRRTSRSVSHSRRTPRSGSRSRRTSRSDSQGRRTSRSGSRSRRTSRSVCRSRRTPRSGSRSRVTSRSISRCRRTRRSGSHSRKTPRSVPRSRRTPRAVSGSRRSPKSVSRSRWTTAPLSDSRNRGTSPPNSVSRNPSTPPPNSVFRNPPIRPNLTPFTSASSTPSFPPSTTTMQIIPCLLDIQITDHRPAPFPPSAPIRPPSDTVPGAAARTPAINPKRRPRNPNPGQSSNPSLLSRPSRRQRRFERFLRLRALQTFKVLSGTKDGADV